MKKLTLSTARLAVLMAVLTAVSKLLGFVREMVLANYFGAGPVTDAYIMAQSIPNNLMAAVISAVGTSYLPAFSAKNEKEGREAADRFTSQLVDLQLLIIAVVVALGCLLARPLISVFAPGFSGETADLTAWYLRFAFFVLFFSVLTYIFGAWLNYKGVFLPQIVYAVAANLVLITVVVISARTDRRLLIIGPLASAALTGTVSGRSAGQVLRRQQLHPRLLPQRRGKRGHRPCCPHLHRRLRQPDQPGHRQDPGLRPCRGLRICPELRQPDHRIDRRGGCRIRP